MSGQQMSQMREVTDPTLPERLDAIAKGHTTIDPLGTMREAAAALRQLEKALRETCWCVTKAHAHALDASSEVATSGQNKSNMTTSE